MKKHGNSNENDADHHLYEIRDREYGDVYKYGICGDPLRKDGSSLRAKRQVKELNRAVRWLRYFANILIIGIPGRIAAKQVEDDYVGRYKKEHGAVPPGNETEEE
ncbi:MAG: hypothetical protein ACKVUS_16935 [Saprospiraceae bacterium]